MFQISQQSPHSRLQHIRADGAFFFFFAAFHRNAPVVSAEKQHASATLHICVQFTDGVFFCLLVKVSITGPSFSLVFTVAALCLCDPAKQLLQASAPPTRPC